MTMFKGILQVFFGGNESTDDQSRLSQAAAQLDALHTLSRSLDDAFRNPEHAHGLVSSSAQTLLGGQTAVLVIYDNPGEIVQVASASGLQNAGSLYSREQRADEGVLGQAILTAESLVRNADHPYEHSDPILNSLDTRNLIVTPIRIGGKEFGALAVDSRIDGEPFDEADVQLLEVFASFAAVVEQGIHVIERLNKKADRLNAVFEISRHLAQFTNLPDLLELVVVRAVELTHATSGSVALFDDESGSLHIKAHVGLEGGRTELELNSGQGITGWVFQHGTGLLVDDVTMDTRYVAVKEDVKSELCVPLRTSNQIVGVLNVDHVDARAFTGADLELLQALADVSSSAIQMATTNNGETR